MGLKRRTNHLTGRMPQKISPVLRAVTHPTRGIVTSVPLYDASRRWGVGVKMLHRAASVEYFPHTVGVSDSTTPADALRGLQCGEKR
jgi:hypothetical protein